MAKTKKYSVTQRLKFHQSRANNPYVSERKRVYSRHWLDGFHDWHPKANYSAVCSEIDFKRKRKMLKNEAPMLFGYKNGLSAQLKNKK